MGGFTKAHRPDSFIRIHLARLNAIGPGKADLLEVIGQTGSLAAAARQMGMSYRRAWNMVKAVNGAFQAPLIETAKGGTRGGGARLTATGKDVLARYRAMEACAAQAIAQQAEEFRKIIRGA